MKKIISLILAILIVLSISPLCSAYTPSQKVISDKAIIMGLKDDGAVLYKKNDEVITQPCTLTKIMTAILAIESAEDISKVKVKASYQGVHALDGNFATYYGIKTDEVYTLLDLVNIMMLCSANDAANVIAVHVGGSINRFVNKMNEKVAELKLENTFFLNPTGLDADGQYTTARDMAYITRYAMNLPIFQQIVKSVSYDIPKNKTHKANTIFNDCELIPTSSYNKYAYEYATGVKTGATKAAGYCVSATAEKDGVGYVCVVLSGKKCNIDGEEYTSALVDSRRLFRWAFSNFKLKAISNETTIVAEVPLRYCSESDYMSLVPEKTITSLVPRNVDESTLIFEPVDMPEFIAAPVKRGEYVCKAKVIHAGEELTEIKLVTYSDAKLSFIKYLGHFVKSAFTNPISLIVILLIAGGIAFYAVNASAKRKRLRRQRQNLMIAKKGEEPRENDYTDKFSYRKFLNYKDKDKKDEE